MMRFSLTHIIIVITILLFLQPEIISAEKLQPVLNKELRVGFKPIDIESITNHDIIKHHIIFVKTKDKVYSVYDLEYQEFNEKIIEFSKKKYRPIDMDIYQAGGKTYYSTVWVDDGNRGFQIHDITDKELFQNWLEINAQSGFYPIKIKTYLLDGKYTYMAITVFGKNERFFFYDYTNPEFITNLNIKKNEGFTPLSISAIYFDHQWKYNVCFIKTNLSSQHIINTSYENFSQFFKKQEAEGYGLIDLSVNRFGNTNKYTACFIKDNSIIHFYSYLKSDISRYDGEMQDDMKHGLGSYSYDAGEEYVGKWSKDAKHGTGTFSWNRDKWDGFRYEGTFKNGLRNGRGKLFYPNGIIYIGNWKDNQQNGEGSYMWNNGEWKGYKFFGEFLNGKRHGPGIVITSDSTKQETNWSSGIRIPIEQE